MVSNCSALIPEKIVDNSGPKNWDVFDDENRSVEKKKMMPAQRTAGAQFLKRVFHG
jgi:hypothetical protein